MSGVSLAPVVHVLGCGATKRVLPLRSLVRQRPAPSIGSGAIFDEEVGWDAAGELFVAGLEALGVR